MLLAAREVQQESLGFSPNDLVFGHRVCGPISVLREGWVEEDLLEYVNVFHRSLFLAGISAQKNLGSQNKMKSHFDKRAECRVFTPGDYWLCCLHWDILFVQDLLARTLLFVKYFTKMIKLQLQIYIYNINIISIHFT